MLGAPFGGCDDFADIYSSGAGHLIIAVLRHEPIDGALKSDDTFAHVTPEALRSEARKAALYGSRR